MNELVGSIQIYAVCDFCFRGSDQLTEVDCERKLLGSDEMVPVRLCPRCLPHWRATETVKAGEV